MSGAKHTPPLVEWLLYEHDDGRYAAAPSAEAATFTRDDPAWHRAGPIQVVDVQGELLAALRPFAAADLRRQGWQQAFRDQVLAARAVIAKYFGGGS